jgi:hypothetical protein
MTLPPWLLDPAVWAIAALVTTAATVCLGLLWACARAEARRSEPWTRPCPWAQGDRPRGYVHEPRRPERPTPYDWEREGA